MGGRVHNGRTADFEGQCIQTMTSGEEDYIMEELCASDGWCEGIHTYGQYIRLPAGGGRLYDGRATCI